MTYTPHTDDEIRRMLGAVGVDTLEALFADVPERVRFPRLDLPGPLSEMELAAELRRLAALNDGVERMPCFLGAGAYRHFVPATVDHVLQRAEFYTAYTPYQPGLSQGMLQAMFEYQSMISRLTGMEVSNASHYDGATSLAEAVLLALDATREPRGRVVMSPSVHPHHRDVVATYLRGTDATLLVPEDPALSAAELAELVDGDTAALVVQSPNLFGQLECLDGIADQVHARGALLIVSADPIALGLFRPPGGLGADVVVADGQPLGLPPSFGGPSLGVFATRRAHIRRLVGRLVGETVDREGQRGYVLTLATREQHIRRARATSNICTNSALGALAAAVYLATVGKRGLRQIAELCFHKSHYAAACIDGIAGVSVDRNPAGRPFFKEFVVDLPRRVAEVNVTLREEHGIIGGFDLGRFFPGQDNRMLVAVTEMNTRAEIDRLVEALRKTVA